MYYGARYYLPGIQHFISADTIVPEPMNTQAFNRYSYVVNNPLKYSDPSGHAPRPPIFPRPTPKMPAPRIPAPSVSPGGGSGSDSDAVDPQDPTHPPDGDGGNNNRDRGTSNTTIPTVADEMYDLVDGDDRRLLVGGRYWKNRDWEIVGRSVGLALDIYSWINSFQRARISWGLGILCAALMYEGGTPGMMEGFRFGYGAGNEITLGSRNLERAAGFVSIAVAAGTDLAGGRTGYDPKHDITVLGGDTVVTTGLQVVGMINDPTVNLLSNTVQLAYDVGGALDCTERTNIMSEWTKNELSFRVGEKEWFVNWGHSPIEMEGRYPKADYINLIPGMLRVGK